MAKAPTSDRAGAPLEAVSVGDAWVIVTGSIRRWLAASPPGRLAARIVDRFGLPKLILGLSMLAWFLIFALYVYRRHDRIGSLAFDLGIFDQSIWLLSNGDGFNTVRGMETFGHHGSVGLGLLVPFYWLGAGPQFINLLQVGLVILGAVPVFMLASRLLDNEWYALIPALAFMTHFSNQWMLQETFHPEVMAITPFLFAYLAARRQRWVPYALLMILAVSWKEDVALAALMFGVVLLFRGQRKAGLWTIAASAAWFLFVAQVLIPSLSPEGDFYGAFFGGLGDSTGGVIWTGLTNPTEIISRLEQADFLGYVRDLGLPFAFVWLLSPLGLLVGLPQLLINLLSEQAFTWDVRLHYAALPVLGFTIATVEGIGRIRRQAVLRFALGAMAALALSTAVTFGISPFGTHFRDGIWKIENNPKQEIFETALAIPGPHDSVSATYNLVPQLTHRRNIYMFPNPWRAAYWGVRDENTHDPTTVEWLVLDEPLLGPEDAAVFEEILANEDWEIVFEEQAILVAHRQP